MTIMSKEIREVVRMAIRILMGREEYFLSSPADRLITVMNFVANHRDVMISLV